MSEDQITSVVQRCYDDAKSTARPTREVAEELLADAPVDLLRRLATEYVVEVVAREQRAVTLASERGAQGLASPQSNRIPRKGSRARAEWEQSTSEGREYAAQVETDEMRTIQMTFGVIGKALERYTEDLRIQWTSELLDSPFALNNGELVTWGDATIEQHEERRNMFKRIVHSNLEGAARHEAAIRELREAGKPTLREMVSANV